MSTKNGNAPQLKMLKDWEQDWVNHIYKGSYSDKIMKPIPSKLYQYKKVSPHTLTQIIDQTIHFSKASSFNDPYDFFIQESSVRSAVKSISNINIADEKAKEGVKALNGKRDNVLISCLTEQNSIIPMWTHYADNGQGICIEFNIEKRKTSIAPHPVFYTYEIDEIFAELVKFEASSVSEHSIPLRQKLLSILALCKHPSWEYEHEWRFFVPFEYVVFNNFKIELPISAIYFGLKTDDNSKRLIKKIVEGKNIILYQMQLGKKASCLEAITI